MKSIISMKSWKTTISFLLLLFLMFAPTVLTLPFIGVSMPSSLSSPASPANGSITYDKGANVITVIGYSSLTPCGFWDLWNASYVNGWNVVNKDYPSNYAPYNHTGQVQYILNCSLQTGDGSNSAYISSQSQQIFIHGAFQVLASGHCVLGSNTSDAVKQGSSMIIDSRDLATEWVVYPSGDFKMYDSYLGFYRPDWYVTRFASSLFEVSVVELLAGSYCDFVCHQDNSFIRTTFNGWDGFVPSQNLVWQDSNIYNQPYGVFGYWVANNNVTFKGLSTVDVTTAFRFDSSSNFYLYLVNPQVASWSFYWSGSSTCAVFRQYEFDLTVTDSSANLQSANVTLVKDGAVVYTALTNSTGQIPTQTLTYGWYNAGNNSNIQDANPFTLLVSKSGYSLYNQTFHLTAKANWMIALQPLTDGGLIEHVEFVPVDPGLTSPSGTYRWLDVADQAYGIGYRNSYNYSQAAVEVAYCTEGNRLQGLLKARNLKPNFAYQLKLVGTPGTADNERIGLGGRWWQEEWTGTTWANGQNLNDKGDGSSPNPNDQTYLSRSYIQDSSSPTGYHYRYTGYLVFNYFITDSNGTATLQFETGSCYHVIWKTTQRSNAANDGPVKTVTFEPAPSQPAYDTDYPSNTVSIFGEWERLPMGQVNLQPGEYNCQILLTEESFHGSGGTLAGNWAGAVTATMMFTTN